MSPTNLYRCGRCGWTTDIGTDDLAGDENVVAARIAHRCRDPWSPAVRLDRHLTDVLDVELTTDQAADPDTLDAMARAVLRHAHAWLERAEQLRAASRLDEHPTLWGVAP